MDVGKHCFLPKLMLIDMIVRTHFDDNKVHH